MNEPFFSRQNSTNEPFLKHYMRNMLRFADVLTPSERTDMQFFMLNQEVHLRIGESSYLGQEKVTVPEEGPILAEEAYDLANRLLDNLAVDYMKYIIRYQANPTKMMMDHCLESMDLLLEKLHRTLTDIILMLEMPDDIKNKLKAVTEIFPSND